MDVQSQPSKPNKRKSAAGGKRLRRVEDAAVDDAAAAAVKRGNKRKSAKPKRRGLGFTFRDRNKFTSRKKRKAKRADLEVCDCPPAIGGGGDAPMCNDDLCTNRQLCIECTADLCRGGDQCQNQRFQKKQNAKFEIFDAGSRGRGLRLLEDVKQGTFIMEYVGEVITMAEMYRRSEDAARHHYAMALGKGECIDPSRYGNYARFINHSCSPNCQTEKWSVGAEEVMGIFALRDIPARTELTFDYQFERVGRKAQRCLCGEPNCCGWIGAKKLKRPNRDEDDEFDEDSEISSVSEMSDSEDYSFPFDAEGTFRPDEFVPKRRRKKTDRPASPRGPILEADDFTVSIGELPMLMRHASFTVFQSEKSTRFLRRNVARGLAFFHALMMPRLPDEVYKVWLSHRGQSQTPFRLREAWRFKNEQGQTMSARDHVEQLIMAAKSAGTTTVQKREESAPDEVPTKEPEETTQ